jgi:hypothetical protein
MPENPVVSELLASPVIPDLLGWSGDRRPLRLPTWMVWATTGFISGPAACIVNTQATEISVETTETQT